MLRSIAPELDPRRGSAWGPESLFRGLAAKRNFCVLALKGRLRTAQGKALGSDEAIACRITTF